MGTKETETAALQEDIKRLCAELGFSQNELARHIYTETHDVDNFKETRCFQERFKKELQRPTTKPEKLRTYLAIICSLRETRKLDVSLNNHVPLGYISLSVSKEMKALSQEVDQALDRESKENGA